MARNHPRSKPGDEASEGVAAPSNESASAFYGFLQQALTLGVKRVRPSALPQFIGLLVYVALAGLLTTSFVWNRPKVMAAAIVMLMIVGVMAILLLLDIGRKIHPIVANAILLLVVGAFLAISAYAVVKLLADPQVSDDSIPVLKQKCMAGSASACADLDKRVQLTCRYDAACIGRAQCWQDKSRALVLLKNVCDKHSYNYNAQGCEFQKQNVGAQAAKDCDTF
jgi:hypothetical protein